MVVPHTPPRRSRRQIHPVLRNIPTMRRRYGTILRWKPTHPHRTRSTRRHLRLRTLTYTDITRMTELKIPNPMSLIRTVATRPRLTTRTNQLGFTSDVTLQNVSNSRRRSHRIWRFRKPNGVPSTPTQLDSTVL